MDASESEVASFRTSIRKWKTVCCAISLFRDPTPVVEAAAEMCRLVRADLVLLHAARRTYAPFGQESCIGCDRELEYWRGRALALGVHAVTVETVDDEPGAAIIGFARNHKVDAIVIGAPTTHWIRDVFLGSVVARVTRAAPCAVLVFPGSMSQRGRATPRFVAAREPLRRGHLYVVK